VFGLHPNANIAYELLTVGSCVDTILSLQPRVAASADEKSPEEIIQELARDILGKLPE
jgi:dynein heavy chain